MRRQFSRRVHRLARGEFLLREVERRMLERLDLIKLDPNRVLDIGCGIGKGLDALSLRYPQSTRLGVDFAIPLLSAGHVPAGLMRRLLGTRGSWPVGRRTGTPLRAGADAIRLPLAESSFDLVWSNLCWHWLAEPLKALDEWYRVIRPGGLLMFSSFGVDTGRELGELGWPLPAFPDMHDIGDALAQAGFGEPVMDTERLTLEYQDANKLVAELSALVGHAAAGRTPRLWPRSALESWFSRLEQVRAQRQGVLSVTVELVYGHAWCGPQKRLPRGLAPVQWREKSSRVQKSE